MIKLSVLYPYSEEAYFNFSYYCNEHAALIKSLLGNSYVSFNAEEGISAGAPHSKPLYTAMGHIYFKSMEEFGAAFPPNKEALMEDIVNFTNITPVAQISEVRL